MQRVVRSTLVGFLTLAGLTACGDKVTIPPVTTAPPGLVVHSVTVSPNSLNLKIGDKVTLAASVDADAGVTDRTVTWSSSNTAIATVDATGLVTAVAGGNATIIAKAKADPNVQGAAAVTVAANVPASVTIGQINTTTCNPTCTSTPAQLNNVHDQLDVTLNVDAGTQTLAGVDLLMNCGGADTVVATQNLSSASLAPAAEESSAPVTLSFNTAAFSPNGVVAFKNGACTLKARARTSAGTQNATSTQQLTLNNTDIVVVVTTNSGSSALDAKSAVWKSGSVTVAATPILYSGRTVSSISITLPGATTPTQSMAPAAGGTTSATWGTGTSGPRVRNLTLKAGTDANGVAIPIHPTVVVVDNQGVDLLLAQGNPTTQSDIRVDNQAPDITTVLPIINLNVQNATNGWVGANFKFTNNATGAPITLDATTTGDNGGVDVVKIETQASVAGANTFTAFTATTALTETSSSTAYDLRLKVCDALNNCSTQDPAVQPFTQFGVDLTPPALTQTGGVKDQQIFNIATGLPTNVSFSVIDTAKTAGVSGSGVSNTTGLLVTNTGLKPDATATGSTTDCSIGTPNSAGTACSSPAQKPITFGVGAQSQQSGDYTMVVTAVDQAGNTSPSITIKYYNDQAIPTVSGGISIPATITPGTSFTGLSGADNMDVKAGNGNLDYGAFKIFVGGSASPAGAAFDNTLTRASSITVTLTTFYRSLADASAGVPNGTGALPGTLNTRGADAAGNMSASNPVTLPAANVGTPVAWSTTSSVNGIPTFSIDSVRAAHTPARPGESITFSVNAKAATNTSGNPLTQVCLFYQVTAPIANISGAAVGELVKIGCSTAGATTSDGTNRFFFYQVSWTPAAGFADQGAINVYAIGNSAVNDALITAPVAVSVVTPP